MKEIISSMLSPLLIGLLLLPERSAWALDRVNVTLPSKSFQFIIFPLARERGYMKEEGIDLNIVVMASTPGLQAVLAGEMDFTGSGSSALVAVTRGNAPLKTVLADLESAEAAGDSYPTAPSLAVNGVGTIAAALFGSCFPTTIYIGHPGWKALGARAGYSILNGALYSVLCLTGSLAILAWLIPIEAGMAIVLWIGIVMAAQAFECTRAITPPPSSSACCPGSAPGAC